ncbi:MAG: hypothetical protein K2Q15_10255 [Burkholderiales bacterium]|jgi:hypothetical protein|nr:hypothetical protein [Burkholderiales bacterium]
MSIYVKPPEGAPECTLQQIYIQASDHQYPLNALYTLQNGKVCNLFEPALRAGHTFLNDSMDASNSNIIKSLNQYSIPATITTTINTVQTKNLLIKHGYAIPPAEQEILKDYVIKKGGNVYLFCNEWIANFNTIFNLHINSTPITGTINSPSTAAQLPVPTSTTHYAFSIVENNQKIYQDSANLPVIARIPIGKGYLTIFGCNWEFTSQPGDTTPPEGLIRRDWETVLIGMLND